jgi:hypothetical protein
MSAAPRDPPPTSSPSVNNGDVVMDDIGAANAPPAIPSATVEVPSAGPSVPSGTPPTRCAATTRALPKEYEL